MGEKIFKRLNLFLTLHRKFTPGYNTGFNKTSVSGKSKTKMHGFTLIELIVVLAVMAIIGTVVISTIDPLAQIRKANDTRRKSDLALMQKYLEEYYNDNGSYPVSTSDKINGVAWGVQWSVYGILPTDSGSSSYAYETDADLGAQAYRLFARLERGRNDLQSCLYNFPAKTKCDNAPTGVCGGECNYVVSSSNIAP